MPKLVIAGLALLATLALAAVVQAAPVVAAQQSYDELSQIEKLRQSEAALWDRLDQIKTNWW